MCFDSGSGWRVEVCLFCCDVPAEWHGEAGGVGAEWGARRGGTCVPLCFVQRATDLSACLSLASRFPPLDLEEPPPLLCAPALCFPSPPESKGGGRSIGLLLPLPLVEELPAGRGETKALTSITADVSSWRLAPVQQRRNAIANIQRMACFLCSVCLEPFY